MKVKSSFIFIFIFLGLISCKGKEQDDATAISSQAVAETSIEKVAEPEPQLETISDKGRESESEENDVVSTVLEYNLDDETKENLLNVLPKPVRNDRLPQKGTAFAPFAETYRYVLQNDEYLIADYFPSFTIITPVEKKADYTKYVFENGNHKKYDFYLKTDSLIFDAVPAFTCNDACVYSSPKENKKTDETIEKYTYVAWLYSDSEAQDFVAIKTFSDNIISKTKYIKKDDIWANEEDVALLYLYKQYSELRHTKDLEKLKYLSLKLSDNYGGTRHWYNPTNMLRKEYKELKAFADNLLANDDYKYTRDFLIEFKTTLKQLDKIKEKFPSDKYDYYIGTEKFMNTNWTSYGQGDTYNKKDDRYFTFRDMDFEWIPSETVFARLKDTYNNSINGFWYFDEKTNEYRLIGGVPSVKISNSLDRISLMDQIQNGNKSNEEIKKLFQQINDIPLKDDYYDESLNRLIVEYRNAKYFTLHNEIQDVEETGPCTAMADSPVLSLPGTLGDELVRIKEDTEIIPVKEVRISVPCGYDDCYEVTIYIYVDQDNLKGWIPADRIKSYYTNTANEATITYDFEHVYKTTYSDTIDIESSKKIGKLSLCSNNFSYADSNSNYLIIEPFILKEAYVYSDKELTEKIGTLPEQSIVLYGQQIGTIGWRSFGDGGHSLYSVKILSPDFEGWVSWKDIYSTREYIGYSEKDCLLE